MKWDITLARAPFSGVRVEADDTQIVVYAPDGSIQAFGSHVLSKYEVAGRAAERAFVEHCRKAVPMTKYDDVIRDGIAAALRAAFDSLADSST